MTTLSKAICWAVAILLIAAGIRSGVVDRDAGITILFILPVLAVLSLRGRICCDGGVA